MIKFVPELLYRANISISTGILYIECGILGMLMFFFASSVNSLNPHGTCQAFKGNIFYSTCNRCNIPFAGANR